MEFEIFQVDETVFIKNSKFTFAINTYFERLSITKRLRLSEDLKKQKKEVEKEDLKISLCMLEKLKHVLNNQDKLLKDKTFAKKYYSIIDPYWNDDEYKIELAEKVLSYYNDVEYDKFIQLYDLEDRISIIKTIIEFDISDFYIQLPEELKKEKDIIIAFLEENSCSDESMEEIEDYLDEELLLKIFDLGKRISLKYFSKHRNLLKTILSKENCKIWGV